MRELQFYKDLTGKTDFYLRWSWFKYSKSGLALGMTLKSYGRRKLKLKYKDLRITILTFEDVPGGKLEGKENFFVPH